MEPNQNEKKTPGLDAGVSEEEIREEETIEQAAAEGQDARPETEEETSEEQPEPAVTVQPEESEKRPGRVKGVLRSSKFKRGGMATLISVLFIAIVVVINVLVSLLTERFPSMNIDLTADKLNSLSDQALEIAKGVERETTIYLIGSEDSYRKDRIYSSYGLEYSQVANLADKLKEANPKISVEFVDPDTNPKFISDYTDENLTTGTVLVQTEKRYKALYASDMFVVQTNQETYQQETYSKVDSALAGALEVVNLDDVPVLAIATGHDEMLTSEVLGGFVNLMEGQNFQVEEVNFLTEEIPADTQVLMLPTPTTDYTEEELQKIRDFLDDETNQREAALLVTCHATQANLPRLAGFLEEWGIQVGEGGVIESDSSRMVASRPNYVLVDPSEEFLTEETYENLMVADSSPLSLLFEGNGDIATRALWTTSDGAYVITEDMTALPEDPETSQQVVTALGTKMIQMDGKNVRRSVIVFGSSYVFTDSFISATAYGNRNYIRDLLQYCTGTDGSNVSVLNSQVQTNVLDVTASQSTVQLLGFGVFTVGLPLAILIVGLVIFLKRRHL